MTVFVSDGKVQNWFEKSFWYWLLWFVIEQKWNQLGSSIWANFYGWPLGKPNLAGL